MNVSGLMKPNEVLKGDVVYWGMWKGGMIKDEWQKLNSRLQLHAFNDDSHCLRNHFAITLHSSPADIIYLIFRCRRVQIYRNTHWGITINSSTEHFIHNLIKHIQSFEKKIMLHAFIDDSHCPHTHFTITHLMCPADITQLIFF